MKITKRSILHALLPAEYREQVTGDLEESGYRARDVLSVLPRVWSSAIRRMYAGPVVAHTGTGETIQARIEQLIGERQRVATWVGFGMGLTVGIALPGAPTLRTGVGLIVALTVALLMRRMQTANLPFPNLILTRDMLLRQYLQTLERSMIAEPIGPFSFLYAIKWLIGKQFSREGNMALATWILVTTALGVWRMHRLRKEWEQVKLSQKA